MRILHTAHTLLLTAAIGLGPCALAQTTADDHTNRCSPAVVQQVAKHLGLRHFSYPAPGMSASAQNGGLIVAGVCKAWPADPSKTLAAFAYDDGTEYEKQLLLAVIDRRSQRVTASHHGEIPEDAASEVSENSLKLDTARYQLSPTTRAFGVRLNTFRERCGYEGGFDDELTLFVMDGKTIRPVLTETMQRWSYGSGNRCAGEEVSRTETHIVIAVEPTASHGFADLRLTAQRSDKKKTLSAIVRYDGERYELKDWKRAFEAWDQ
jgi:hypothetical protein